MKTRIYLYSLSLMAVFAFFLFVSPDPAVSYDEKNPMNFKVGLPHPPQNIISRTLKRVGDLAQERTNGRLKFEYYYSGSLIKFPQFVDGVAMGMADMGTGPTFFVDGKIPDLNVFGAPGCFPMDKYLEVEKAIGPVMDELLATKGVHYVMSSYTGPSVFGSRTQFMKSPADWKGLKMRMPGRWLSALTKQWGASPVFTLPPELYLALQTGVVDGYLLIWDIIYGLKLYEVSPYLVDTGAQNGLEFTTMNLKKWKSLTKTDQDIFNKITDEVQKWNVEETIKYYEVVKKDIIAKGTKIYDLNPQERKEYVKHSFALWPEIRKASGKYGNQLADIMEKFNKEAYGE
ncbi:MAG: TRAP transporter substrate-binding protein [Pseudomonadota bacterium]